MLIFHLIYFAQKSVKQDGEISLSDIRVVKTAQKETNHINTFSVICKDDTVHYFAAQKAKEAAEWMTLLKTSYNAKALQIKFIETISPVLASEYTSETVVECLASHFSNYYQARMQNIQAILSNNHKHIWVAYLLLDYQTWSQDFKASIPTVIAPQFVEKIQSIEPEQLITSEVKATFNLDEVTKNREKLQAVSKTSGRSVGPKRKAKSNNLSKLAEAEQKGLNEQSLQVKDFDPSLVAKLEMQEKPINEPDEKKGPVVVKGFNPFIGMGAPSLPRKPSGRAESAQDQAQSIANAIKNKSEKPEPLQQDMRAVLKKKTPLWKLNKGHHLLMKKRSLNK